MKSIERIWPEMGAGDAGALVGGADGDEGGATDGEDGDEEEVRDGVEDAGGALVTLLVADGLTAVLPHPAASCNNPAAAITAPMCLNCMEIPLLSIRLHRAAVWLSRGERRPAPKGYRGSVTSYFDPVWFAVESPL